MKCIANLLPTLCVIEYSEEMNLELHRVTDSLRNDVRASLQIALENHKEQIQIEYLTFLFVHSHTNPQVMNWGICELLEPAETQLPSIILPPSSSLLSILRLETVSTLILSFKLSSVLWIDVYVLSFLLFCSHPGSPIDLSLISFSLDSSVICIKYESK